MGRDEKSQSDYKEAATGIINKAVADKDKYKSILQRRTESNDNHVHPIYTGIDAGEGRVEDKRL